MNLALAGLELTIVDKAVLELVMILLPLSLEHWDFWPVSQGPASFTVFNVCLLLLVFCVSLLFCCNFSLWELRKIKLPLLSGDEVLQHVWDSL